MSKLPLPNLPVSNAAADSYERRLSVKLNENFSAHRQAINKLAGILPVYANNAAAVAGGLVEGDHYRTGADPDFIAVVH